jgi:integrase
VPHPGSSRRRPEGVVVRHARGCGSRTGREYSCRPGYQAQVWSPRDGKTIRKTFRALADARAWRAEAQTALRRGTLRAPSRTTLAQAAADWLEAAKAGVVRTRSGDPYKPSALRGYAGSLRTKLMPELGHLRLSAVTRACVQDLVDRMVADGFGPSTVRNAVLPLRAIYRRAVSRSEVLVGSPRDDASLCPPRGAEQRASVEFRPG